MSHVRKEPCPQFFVRNKPLVRNKPVRKKPVRKKPVTKNRVEKGVKKKFSLLQSTKYLFSLQREMAIYIDVTGGVNREPIFPRRNGRSRARQNIPFFLPRRCEQKPAATRQWGLPPPPVVDLWVVGGT
jgi:hypothetical protein